MASKAQQKKVAAKRLQRKQCAPIPTTMLTFCQTSSLHEPLTPQSPSDFHPASSSRHTSFSTASSGYYSDTQMLHISSTMNQPPTPQSPYYDEPDNHRPISPAAAVVHRNDSYHTPTSSQQGSVNGSFDGGLRIILETPTHHQLLMEQTLQSSPGSLSSCSSVSSHSSMDYFLHAPQQPSTPYQSPYPISPCSVPHYSTDLQQAQHGGPQFHPNVQYQSAPFSAAAQHVWFEMPHQHLMAQHTQRIEFDYDMPYIKQEPEIVLPSRRGSFC